MSGDADNPYERWDLDPEAGIEGLTESLRDRLEEATSDEEREALRKAWEELTLHPGRRLEAALGAHPARPPLGAPPPRLPRAPVDERPRGLYDLLLRPRLVEALPEPAGTGPWLPDLPEDPELR
jgi:hypothetical protein